MCSCPNTCVGHYLSYAENGLMDYFRDVQMSVLLSRLFQVEARSVLYVVLNYARDLHITGTRHPLQNKACGQNPPKKGNLEWYTD